MYRVQGKKHPQACGTAYIHVRCSTTRFVYNTNLATAYNHGHPCPLWKSFYRKPFENSLLNSVLPCTLSNVEFAGQTRCCSISRTSLSVLKMLGAYKKHPQARPKMNILVHFWAASLQANWLLFRTSGIRAASATLRINLCAARSSCTLSVSLLK